MNFFRDHKQLKINWMYHNSKDKFIILLWCPQISTLQILDVDDQREVGDDQIFTMKQLIRHVSLALKKYFEAHICHKVDEIKRSHARSDDNNSPIHEIPPYKVNLYFCFKASLMIRILPYLSVGNIAEIQNGKVKVVQFFFIKFYNNSM